MKNELKVLSLQFEAADDKDKNLKKVAKMFKENKDFEPDLVILPELWNTGLFYENFPKEAEFIPAQTTMLLAGLAEAYNTNIIGGSIIEQTFDGKLYNTSLVINRQGAVISQYRKNHLFSHCDSKEHQYLTGGDEICTFELENIKFGIGICYDIRFPEHFRKMIKDNVEIFIIPAAFPAARIEQWNILNQARALENLAVLVSCNQYGASNYISPYGIIKNTSESGEFAIRNIIDLEEISAARKNTPFLNDIKPV